MNNFSLLDNLQEESEAFKFHSFVEKTATVKNKNKFNSKPQKNKILTIGDSHARCCATILSNLLGKNFEVMGAVMHDSRHENIIHLVCTEIGQLHCDDDVIIWGGANDINRN
jgi:hypothetical protein